VTDVDVTFEKESSSQRIVLPLDDLSDPWDVSGVAPRARLLRGELRINATGNAWEYRTERNAEEPPQRVRPDEVGISVEGHQFESEMKKALQYLAKRHGNRTSLDDLALAMQKERAVARHIMDALGHAQLVMHHFGIGADYGYTISSRGTTWLISKGLIR
jgi:hypothetical protein